MPAIRRNASSLQASQRARHLDVLKRWKQTTQFSQQDDWVFASPVKLGRLPWSYPNIWRTFQDAAKDAGGGKLGTHTMRHSYRSWLDLVSTAVGLQQQMMRHASSQQR